MYQRVDYMIRRFFTVSECIKRAIYFKQSSNKQRIYFQNKLHLERSEETGSYAEVAF